MIQIINFPLQSITDSPITVSIPNRAFCLPSASC
ncbi:Uncharacterised protein [Vibrio cholerae]|nr:Uncharacterised protein [Vibrio cholerae]